jgi:hypothetical protein
MANGKAQAAAINDQAFEDFKRNIRETANLFGGLIMFPFLVFIGCAYGLRAGIIVSLRKTLELLKAYR